MCECLVEGAERLSLLVQLGQVHGPDALAEFAFGPRRVAQPQVLPEHAELQPKSWVTHIVSRFQGAEGAD
eukprot:2869717-Prymnesium_polylepis.1